MSGGSFNYLYVKDAYQLLAGEGSNDLAAMREELAALDAHDAANATADVLRSVAAAGQRVDAIASPALRQLWHAVEWWRSGDWGIERVMTALEEYRKPSTPACPTCGHAVTRIVPGPRAGAYAVDCGHVVVLMPGGAQ